MRKIEVLGSGCSNCHRLAANATEAAASAGVAAEVIHVTDMREIVRRGVMSTPGLAIDGQIVSTGRVASAADIARWLTEQS